MDFESESGKSLALRIYESESSDKTYLKEELPMYEEKKKVGKKRKAGNLKRYILKKVISAAFVGLVPSSFFAKVFAFGGKKKNKAKADESKKHRWGMVIDLDLCTGCGACVVACKVENNIPFTGTNEVDRGTEIEWMSILDYKGVSLPIPCLQCDNPPCTKVCPVGATYINEEGIVAQIWDRCIGCRYCQVSCPYERKFFNWKKPEWPDTYIQMLNPDVAPRPKGVVEKCTFCYHRIRKVKEKARDEKRDIRDEEVRYLPACAEACPTRAIVFGDLEDPDSLVSHLAKSPRAFRLVEHLGTKPKVIYLAEEKRKKIVSLLMKFQNVEGG